jgi:putative inorganic carbon (hco3(-)) transporter
VGDSLLFVILTPFLALTTDWLPRLLLAVAIFDIPLQVGTHFYYREKEAALGAIGGWSVSATTIALTGLYVSWLIRSLLGKKLRRQPACQINIALLAYVAMNIVSVLVAQDVSLALFETILLLESSLLFFYVANVVRNQRDVLFVVSCLLIGCLLESGIMIVMRVAATPTMSWNFPIHLHADWGGHGSFMRVGGTVGSPNFAAGYLSICLALAASVLLTNLSGGYKALGISVLGLGCVALILTFSRGGWTALVLALFVLAFGVWHRRGLSLKMPLAAAGLFLLLYLPFHNQVSARLFGDDKGSAESRVPLMHLAFRIVEANPVLGVGVNNFTVVMNRYLSPEFREAWRFTVHNKYLLVLAETGAIGLLAFLAFLLGTLRKGWLCWRLCDEPLSLLALGFVAGLVGHMVHMTVDVFRGRPTQQLIWLIAGLLTAMFQMRRSVSSPAAPRRRAHRPVSCSPP